MGGTTTDIALVESQGPRLSPTGARVGRWRTMVEAIDVHTGGLGGDSWVWLDESNDIALGPRRVIPLALLATQHPVVLDHLKRMVDSNADTPSEFWVLQSETWPEIDGAPAFSHALRDRLLAGPLPLGTLGEIVTYPQLYRGYLDTLERQGIVLRSGITPTDAAHLTGVFQPWDAEASRLGLTVLGRILGHPANVIADGIMRLASRRIASQILAKLLADDGLVGQTTDDIIAQHLIQRALEDDREASLSCQITVRPAIVAIGAPAPTYFGPVAEMLHAELFVPEHAGVANALGAVAGSVVSRVRATILPQQDETLRVFLPDEMKVYVKLEDALAYARHQVRRLARAHAAQAGAQDVRVRVERQDRTAPVANGWGDPVFLSTTLGRHCCR